MPYLELDNLEKCYDGIPAVSGLHLSIESGEFVSLLGPSGCGKTTTLRMVGGFITPTQGSIRLGGEAIEGKPPHQRNMGFVFQNYALFPHMTALGNVSFGLQMRHLPPATVGDKAYQALELVGLKGLERRYPSQLSGGQQQRVALARALVIEPKVLLLDEPLSNLDAALRTELRQEIAQLQRRLGITTLFVTHDQEEALCMSDRIVVMNRGQVVEVASPRTLSESPQHTFTAQFLGSRSLLPGRVQQEGTKRLFVTAKGLHCPMPPDTPETPTYLVLRAARLRLIQEGLASEHPVLPHPATVERVTYTGDHFICDLVAVGERFQVIRPSTEPEPSPGSLVYIGADPGGLSWLAESS